MLGLEAIAAHNGWAMAITGTIIVMSGLAVLSFIISQLHKIIGLFEEKKKESSPVTQLPQLPADFDILNDIETAAELYKPLAVELGDSFLLQDLYRLFEREKLDHPHLTIRALRDADYLQPLDDGLFGWKEEDPK